MMLRVLEAKEKAKNCLPKLEGNNVLTDNAGMVIVGFLIVMVLIVWAVPWTRDTLLPALGSQIMGLFNYNG